MLLGPVKAAYARLSFDNVFWVGADEMNRRKNNYLTVFADLRAKRSLFATPGRDSSVWEPIAADLLRHDGHTKRRHRHEFGLRCVKGVSDNLGNAQIVYDEFHVT
jgi:transposase